MHGQQRGGGAELPGGDAVGSSVNPEGHSIEESLETNLQALF